MKKEPKEILETLYYLRLNSSQPKFKLDLNLKQKAKELALTDFEKSLIKMIFSGDNKKLVLDKQQALETCFHEISLTLPLKEFLTKTDPNKLSSFLKEIFSVNKYEELNPEIVHDPEYRKLIESFNRSDLIKKENDFNTGKDDLKLADYGRILNQDEIREALYSDKISEKRVYLTNQQRLEKLKKYFQAKPDFKARLDKYLEGNKSNLISAKAMQNEVLEKLKMLTDYSKNQLVRKIVNEYQIDKASYKSFINKAKQEDIETLLNAFTYREQVYQSGIERNLIDQIILNYIKNENSEFISEKAEAWVEGIKKQAFDFDSSKLKQDFKKKINDFDFEVISEPIKFFSISTADLYDYSCYGPGLKHGDKLLNHALNMHTNCILIKKNDVKVARALISINDEGDINIYPLHKYDQAIKNEDLEQSLKKYVKDYKVFLGLNPLSKGDLAIKNDPIPIFNVPSRYDSRIAVI